MQSRLSPQHPQWYADLPEREAPDQEPPTIFDDLNSVNENYLEISRAGNKMRGAMIFFSIPAFASVFFGVWLFGSDIPGLILEVPLFAILLPFMLLATVAVGFFALRIDLTPPRDEPIRFNRKRGKVYVTEFKHTWNPFGKWTSIVKEFDWNTLQAEVTKYAGFNGKAYQVRYSLNLVSVKPGTLEVVDRVCLVGNNPFDNNFAALWAYIKKYMQGGPIIQPQCPLKDHTVNFGNSVREWLPYLNFTELDRVLPTASWGARLFFIVMTALLLPFAPMFLVIALFHYIAMRCAPEAVWPSEIDAKSKSAAS